MRLLLLVHVLIFIPRDVLGHLNPAAASLLRQLNPAIDPCDDFYEFVCGKYVTSNSIPDDDIVKSWRTDIRDLKIRKLINLLSKPMTRRDIAAIRKAKLFFRSCLCVGDVEKQSVAKALEYLNSKGGTWPTFDPNWSENDLDLETSLAFGALQDGYDVSGTVLGPFIRFRVVRDWAIPRPVTSLQVSRPAFLLKSIDLSEENLAAVESLIIDSLRLLGADDAIAEEDGKAIFEFEMALQGLPLGGIGRYPVSEVQEKFAYIDWFKYLNGALKTIGRIVKGEDVLQHRYHLFFEQLGTFLTTTPKRTIANDIKWRMFQLLLPAMPDSIRERFLRVETLLTGVKSLPRRLKHCVLTTNSEAAYYSTQYGMGHAVSRMLVQSTFNRFDKHMAETIGTKVTAMISSAVENSSWLSKETKSNLKGKLDAMVAEHIFQEATSTDQYLNTFYRDFHIQRRGFVENLINTAQGIVRRNLEELDNPIENRWWYHTSVGTAVNLIYLNQFIVSAQWLYPDGLNFDLLNPMAINYATAGYVSGHETIHSIMRRGFYSDEDGQYVGNIYSSESWDAYLDREMCIIEQYSEYDVPFTNDTKINGALGARENVPDNIGVKFSFLAYENYVRRNGEEIFTKFPFTPRQLFFLANARKRCEIRRPKSAERRAMTVPHSPGKWRTNGPFRNLPEFAEQFHCPLGSFMNPGANRCTIL